jgi:hemoglobin-like flavoprotein
MELSQQQIRLIKQSWQSFRGVNPILIADIFYTKLFTDQPQLRKMFPTNMEKQHVKLMDMLTSIVTRIERLEEIGEELIAMAERHAGYGVKPAHYKAVGNALCWTLEKGLGNSWNEELKSAWICCYTILSDKMRSATPG